jgi:hypothetical protein
VVQAVQVHHILELPMVAVVEVVHHLKVQLQAALAEAVVVETAGQTVLVAMLPPIVVQVVVVVEDLGMQVAEQTLEEMAHLE